MSSLSKVTCALLTTTIGAIASTPASASFISTDTGGPVQFDPLVNGPSFSIDVDGSGTTDYTISSSGGNLNLTAAGSNQVDEFAGGVATFASTSAFVAPGSVKFTTNPAVISTATFSSFTNNPFGELVFNVNGGTETGYISGTTTTIAPIPSQVGLQAPPVTDTLFTLNDYGYDPASFVPTPVPEPASLALLATGAAGLAAFRLRRASARS